MLFSVKRNDLLCVGITILMGILSNFGETFVNTLAIWIFVYSLLKLFTTKNNIFIILELFMLIYAIVPIIYFIVGASISPYQHLDYDNYKNMVSVLQIQSVFVVVFLSFAPIDTEFSFSNIIVPRRQLFSWAITAFLMVISLLFVNWRSVSVYFRGSYSIETESSIIFDYFMIFVVVNRFFCDAKWQKRLNMILTIIVSFVCVMIGKRLTAITNLLLIYILDFNGKIKKRTLIWIAAIGILVFNSIQFTRVGQIPTILNVLTGITIEHGVYRGNSCDVWYASEVIYKLIDTGVFDWTFRIKSFLGTFLNSFLTTSLTPKEALVNVYITENALFPYTANGGLIGVSTYLWLGYAGVVLFAIIICRIIKEGFKSYNMFKTLYAMLVLATFPRWYTYNPRILFKFAFVAVMIFAFVKLFSRTDLDNDIARETTK